MYTHYTGVIHRSILLPWSMSNLINFTVLPFFPRSATCGISALFASPLVTSDGGAGAQRIHGQLRIAASWKGKQFTTALPCLALRSSFMNANSCLSANLRFKFKLFPFVNSMVDNSRPVFILDEWRCHDSKREQRRHILCVDVCVCSQEEIMRQFDQLDVNGTGSLTIGELVNVIREIMAGHHDSREIDHQRPIPRHTPSTPAVSIYKAVCSHGQIDHLVWQTREDSRT